MIIGQPNSTDDVNTDSKHWYISYNAYDVSIYGDRTTALVLGQMEYFLILNGDHRKAFKKILETPIEERKWKTGLHCCLDYVRKNKSKLNEKSDPIF